MNNTMNDPIAMYNSWEDKINEMTASQEYPNVR